MDLGMLDCEWFDRIYIKESNGRPSLEKRAAMLRGLGITYTDRQIRDFRSGINQGLHLMRQECKPSLVIKVYSLITALSMSDQIPFSEVNKYIETYRQALEKKCEHLQQNFD